MLSLVRHNDVWDSDYLSVGLGSPVEDLMVHIGKALTLRHIREVEVFLVCAHPKRHDRLRIGNVMATDSEEDARRVADAAVGMLKAAEMGMDLRKP